MIRRRAITIFIVVWLFVGVFPAAMFVAGDPAPLAQQSGSDTNETTTPTAEPPSTSVSESIAPGTKLAGVVAVGSIEVDGELTYRTLDRRLAAATTNRSKARVIASTITALDARLDTLETRRERLSTARETGSITDEQYRVAITQLVAAARTVEQLLERVRLVAAPVPPGVLDAQGVTPAAIAVLDGRASTLIDREAAAIAATVVGERVGTGFGSTRTDGDDRKAHSPSQDSPPTGDGTEGTETTTEAPTTSTPPDSGPENEDDGEGETDDDSDDASDGGGSGSASDDGANAEEGPDDGAVGTDGNENTDSDSGTETEQTGADADGNGGDEDEDDDGDDDGDDNDGNDDDQDDDGDEGND